MPNLGPFLPLAAGIKGDAGFIIGDVAASKVPGFYSYRFLLIYDNIIIVYLLLLSVEYRLCVPTANRA